MTNRGMRVRARACVGLIAIAVSILPGLRAEATTSDPVGSVGWFSTILTEDSDYVLDCEATDLERGWSALYTSWRRERSTPYGILAGAGGFTIHASDPTPTYLRVGDMVAWQGAKPGDPPPDNPNFYRHFSRAFKGTRIDLAWAFWGSPADCSVYVNEVEMEWVALPTSAARVISADEFDSGVSAGVEELGQEAVAGASWDLQASRLLFAHLVYGTTGAVTMFPDSDGEPTGKLCRGGDWDCTVAVLGPRDVLVNLHAGVVPQPYRPRLWVIDVPA